MIKRENTYQFLLAKWQSYSEIEWGGGSITFPKLLIETKERKKKRLSQTESVSEKMVCVFFLSKETAFRISRIFTTMQEENDHIFFLANP